MKKTFIILSLLFFVFQAPAQSLKDLVLSLPPMEHPFGSKDAVERLFKIPLNIPSKEAISLEEGNKEKEGDNIEGLLRDQLFDDTDFKVILRSEDQIVIQWEDATTLSLSRLPSKKRGNILMLIRSNEKPFPISTISFFDREGKTLLNSNFLPLISGILFAKKDTPIEIKDLFILLPLSYSYDAKNKLLMVTPSLSGYLSLEESKKLKEYIDKETRLLLWNERLFQLI